MKEGGEADLAAESTHVSTRRTRKAVAFKEEFCIEHGEPMDGENVRGRRDPCRRSATREEKEGRWTSRAPYVTGRRDEDIYYCEHRSGTAPSSFCGDEGCRNISQPQGCTREDAEGSGEFHRRCRNRDSEKDGPCP